MEVGQRHGRGGRLVEGVGGQPVKGGTPGGMGDSPVEGGSMAPWKGEDGLLEGRGSAPWKGATAPWKTGGTSLWKQDSFSSGPCLHFH